MAARSALLDSFGDDSSWSHALLDATPDGILVVAGSGEIAFANDQVGEMLCCAPEDLIGQNVDVLLPEALRQVHRAHRTRYRVAPTPREMGAGLLLRARRADATEFPVEISLKPLRHGDELFVVAAVRDVTDRVAAEDHLRRVLHTLDASDDGVFIFDADSLQFSYVNDGAVRLIGYTRDELLAMTPMHLNPDVCEGDYRDLVDTLLVAHGTSIVREERLLRKDGSEVPVEKTFQAAPIGLGGVRWIVSLARDICSRLAAEAELRESQQALQAAEQVLAVAKDRERIARDLHDTVIQRLFGAGLNLQALASGARDPVRGRLEATISELDETIKELRMAIFSLQGGVSAPGGLRGRLLDVVTDAGSGLGFEPRLQFEGPVESIDDETAEELLPTLREALSNVARHAQARNVRVSVSVIDEVVLCVEDDGVGVPQEVVGGRGLSNMVTRAERLGGASTIIAGPGGGSRLEWRVPLYRVPAESVGGVDHGAHGHLSGGELPRGGRHDDGPVGELR